MFTLGLGWNLVALTGAKVLAAHPSAQGPADSLGFAGAALGTLLGGLALARWGFGVVAWTAGILSLLPLWSAWQVRRAQPAQAAPA
ncbi:hypothetical protein ACFP81_05285 [Deinococcus lacus]|uniref:MFS transporter n=1 Tax=Deinococcus lacus TaxID=392561 RepID=A0ABW1YB01_9DEIO